MAETYDDSNVERDQNIERMDRELPEAPGAMKASDLNGKAVISKTDGVKLGQIEDLLVDPGSLSISGLVVSQGNLLDRERQIVSSTEIESWGVDAILVREQGVIKPAEDYPERDSWVSVGNKIRGQTIVTTTGEKIGQVDDVMVDTSGQIVAYTISQGLFAQDKTIPAQATETLGGDVMIVNLPGNWED